MKTVLCSVLLLLMLSNFTSGQSGPSNFNPNILVHSEGLPNEFLLFVPDTATQILFNPARANDYQGSFVYSTYAANFKRVVYIPVYPILDYTNSIRYPYYTFPIPEPEIAERYGAAKNPTLSVATLFNAFNTKWLLTVTNGIGNFSSSTNSNTKTFFNDSYYKINLQSYLNSNEVETKASVTSFRLSNIFNSKLGKSSAGLFAVITTNSEVRKTGLTSTQYRETNNALLQKYNYLNSQNNKWETNDSYVLVGAELSFAKDKWDNILRIGYRKSNLNSSNNYCSGSQSFDTSYYSSTSASSSRSSSTNKTSIKSELEPYTLIFENYYQHQTSFLSLEGNIFLSVNGYYTKGEGKGAAGNSRESAYYSNGILVSRDTSRNSSTDKTDDKNWGFVVSPGWIVKKSFSDLFLLTGIKVVAGYQKYNSTQTVSLNPDVAVSNTKSTNISFALPLYLHYSPAEWISLWGGMTYFYGYTKIESSDTFNKITYNNYSYWETTIGNENTSSSGYQSSKSTFLGLELKHSSGLRVQISFDEDVASFRDWNMSIGYHF